MVLGWRINTLRPNHDCAHNAECLYRESLLYHPITHQAGIKMVFNADKNIKLHQEPTNEFVEKQKKIKQWIRSGKLFEILK